VPIAVAGGIPIKISSGMVIKLEPPIKVPNALVIIATTKINNIVNISISFILGLATFKCFF
jgi:hypothetical protein